MPAKKPAPKAAKGKKAASRPPAHKPTVARKPAERDYTIRMQIPEFTCLCPKTGQPDFATLDLEYVPDQRCVELKSLKLYIWSFRDRGTFHEAVTNEIADHLTTAMDPRFLRLTARFNVRGGDLHDGRRRAATGLLEAASARFPSLATDGHRHTGFRLYNPASFMSQRLF